MRSFGGHVGIVEALAFSPDGRTLASGGADGRYRLWDAVTGVQKDSGKLSASDPIGAVAFSPDGNRLAVGDYGGRVRDVDLSGREEPRTWEKQGRVVGVAFAPDNYSLAWASYSGVFVTAYTGDTEALIGATPRPFCLAQAPDNSELAIGCKSAQCQLWGLETEGTRSLSHGSEQGCWSVSYSHDSRSLALALGDGAQVWDRLEGQMLLKLSGHEDVVSGVCFSPDGRRLATCSWDQTVRLYDVTAGMALVGSYDWKIGRLFCVAFSPDGTLAAVGGDQNGGLVAWDVE